MNVRAHDAASRLPKACAHRSRRTVATGANCHTMAQMMVLVLAAQAKWCSADADGQVRSQKFPSRMKYRVMWRRGGGGGARAHLAPRGDVHGTAFCLLFFGLRLLHSIGPVSLSHRHVTT